MLDIVCHKKQSIVIYSSAIFLLCVFMLYNIVWDVFVIALVCMTAYNLGCFCLRVDSGFENLLLKFGLGLGILCLLYYFVFLLGIGSSSIVSLIMFLPIILNRKVTVEHIKLLEKRCMEFKIPMLILWTLVITFFIICGSAPIDRYDSLSKHLPIALYAARSGKFYINVIESNVYAEPMAMQYGISAAFLIMGAEKALALFNVMLLFATGWGGYCAFRRIAKELSAEFFIIGLISIPIFFELGTIFYIDILPVFFLVIVLVQIISFDSKECWEKIVAVAFCLGCSFFAKLTSSCSILVLGLTVFVCSLYFVFKMRIRVRRWLRKYLFALCAFVLPSITSMLYIGYMTGNPLFYFFNSIFKSPYFYQNDYGDPFTNVLGMNLQSLFDMVFNTSFNIEMQDGGLGIFLLGIVIIPIFIVWKKNKQVAAWSVLTLTIYYISCLFSYNLRYMLFSFILVYGLICASLFELKKHIPVPYRKISTILIGIVFIVPNLFYLFQNENLIYKMGIDGSLCRNENSSVLCNIPTGKRIFSINDCFKGDYDGFYNSFTWHNSVYNTENLLNGKVSYKEYLKAFDYILCDKRNAIPTNELEELLQNDNMVKLISESSTHLLYEVVLDKKELVIGENYETPVESQVLKPLTKTFIVESGTYFIEQDVENIDDCDIEMRFQINWFDRNNQFITTSLYTYTLPAKTRLSKRSIGLESPPNATIGQLYVTSHTEKVVNIYGYEVELYPDSNYITNETNKFYNRELLRNQRRKLN